MRLRIRHIAGSLIFCIAIAALATQLARSAADTSAPLKIDALPSPAGANSSEPQFTAQGDRVILSWVELTGQRAALKFAERTASGWST